MHGPWVAMGVPRIHTGAETVLRLKERQPGNDGSTTRRRFERTGAPAPPPPVSMGLRMVLSMRMVLCACDGA
jgi:hypothetical protein